MLGSISLMFAQVLSWAENCFGVFIASIPGMFGFLLAGFTIYAVTRLLISPILGDAGSDQVKKKKGKKDG